MFASQLRYGVGANTFFTIKLRTKVIDNVSWFAVFYPITQNLPQTSMLETFRFIPAGKKLAASLVLGSVKVVCWQETKEMK